MGEFAKQLERYRMEQVRLHDIYTRVSLRLSELAAQIKALETLENQSQANSISKDALDYLDRLLPKQNGSEHTVLSNPPYRIHPTQKSHIVLSVMYHQQRGEMTSAQVFDAVTGAGYKLSKQDIYKAVSRFVKMGRLEKSKSGAFALTDAGVKLLKVLDSEAHLVGED
jgi:Holliday junction resolvasome RuvABC endonuclease subunit